MKKIKNVNGYTIYQAGPRDVKKYGFSEGGFYVYFASDVKDFGLPNSTPEFEDCGNLEEAEANCTGNFAIAKEIVEERTTAASMDEILEVEAMLDAGADPESLDSEALEPERIRSRCDNTTLTRIVDRWNPRKVWLIKRYADGHFALNQEVGGRVLYSRFVRASKQRIDEIFACCTAEGGEPPGVSLTISSELSAVRNYPPALARYLEQREGGKSMDRVAQVINNKIQERGVTLAFVSNQAQMSECLLRKSLDGKRSFMADELVNLCRALDLEFEDFQASEHMSE